MRILILSGGDNKEREISLWSAGNISQVLNNLGHKVDIFDLSEERVLSEAVKQYDVIFPILHGKEGEGGQLQELLESLKVNFIGPTSWTCKKGWEKFKFKEFCNEERIKTPNWQKVGRISEIEIKLPYVLKPSDDGSSVDTFVVKDINELGKQQIKDAFETRKFLLVEEFIDGVEVTSGIWGDKVLPLLEIRLPEGEIFDYENKYNGRTQEIPFAPSLSKEMQDKVNLITEKIRKKLKVRHFSRVDYMVRGLEVFALEINTIPGMTSESLLPKAIIASGLSMEESFKKIGL